MKVEKFKVLLYLKKSGLDKSGKAPIMGRITVNRTMAQFGCKLSCTPELWNPRESRLNGKSKEAVETNARIEKLLLAVNNAFDSLVSRKVDFDATDVKNHFQGSMETQMTLMRMTDVICDDLKARIGIDRAKGTYPGYHYTRLTLGEFIEHQYKVKDLAFGQLTEQFIHDYQAFAMENKGYAIDTVRPYLAILKKICRLAYKNADGRRYIRINRKKTKVEAFIPLHSIAEQILSLYNTTDDEKPVFPLPCRDALWFDIHEMGVVIGKEENLSYHQSRHSFGTFLISAVIPIESIAKMMGHSNIRTTQGYARITDDKISKDMDKLMERRKMESTDEKKKKNSK